MTVLRNDRRRRRGGFTLIELAMALLLLGVAMGVTMKVLSGVGRDRRAADRRQWALQEVANVMERVGAEPFERVTAERALAIAGELKADRVLPEASWEIAVTDDRDSPVPGRRVSVRLRWKDRSGGWDSPVRLTSWVYRRRTPS